MALCCVLAASVGYSIRWLWSGSRSEKVARFRSLLEHDERIESVSIDGYEEEFGLFTVTSASFSIHDKPNSVVVLFVYDNEQDFESLNIVQIGNLKPMILEWNSNVSQWTPLYPDLGRDSTGILMLSNKARSVSDVVTHYYDLIGYFDKWPVFPDFEVIKNAEGKGFRRYVIRKDMQAAPKTAPK
jgi:hypothetical protein